MIKYNIKKISKYLEFLLLPFLQMGNLHFVAVNILICKTIASLNEMNDICFTELKSYHWEQNPPYRPNTYFKLVFLRGEGFYCVLKCYEKSPKAVYTENDTPIYRDSCLEFFLCPIEKMPQYINIECNSLGFSLSEFGEGRQNRSLVYALANDRPRVKPFSGSDSNGDFWGVEIFVSIDLISTLYNEPAENLVFDDFSANFYKCGDDTDFPHYIAFSPVSSVCLGFHNPDDFEKFMLI